jgi:hypothetical protein
MVLLSVTAASSLLGDATVTTLGGGRLTPTGPDAGFTDGDILQMSQFNTPSGCAVDLSGRICVADRNNGALRRLDLAANRCRTLLTGLNQPVAVAVDQANAVYILTHGDGTLQKLDRGVVSVVTRQLSSPTAITYDGTNTFFVTQSDGTIMQIGATNGVVTGPIVTGLRHPGGIALLDNGLLAVTETAAGVVTTWDPKSGSMVEQIGSGLIGFADGPFTLAQFNQPAHLAKAPGGSIVVADQGNDRVRLIEPDGFVSTIYGVNPATWEGPQCLDCAPMILPGWLDGSAEFAEARQPVGVAVTADGTIFTTEVFYQIVREVSGATFVGGGGGATNVVVLPPTFAPTTGYFPMGQTISVVNPNASPLLATAVYYTTDGSEPTTNSFLVPMNGANGALLWQEKQRDLSSLRLKAFLGNNPSPTVSGQAVTASEIGVPQDIAAGIGSTAIVPIVLNLATNDQVQTLQFRVEVTPNSDTTPMIPEIFGALSTSTNDMIPVVTSQSQGQSIFRMLPYSLGTTRGLAITFIGTNANLRVKNFGAAALLTLPIPPTAKVGDTYTLNILNPSATSDSVAAAVSLTPMPSRNVVVTQSHYLVGDSSVAIWYNAAQMEPSGALRQGFGNGLLDNADVNNVFAAATGIRVPFPNSDIFDAMDTFPEDTTTTAGGDGLIRFLDWQVVLMRSLGLDAAQWQRSWSDGGIRLPSGGAVGAAPDQPGQLLSTTPAGAVWLRQVTLSAQQMDNLVPGTSVDVPVSVQVAAGSQLAGLAFRVTVQPNDTAPALDQAVEFVTAPNLPAPAQNLTPSLDSVACGWPLVPGSSFDPPLQGTQLLGWVRIKIPSVIQTPHSYTVRFANADGSPDLVTQYNFDTRSAALWVLSPAPAPQDPTSDEWKLHFFGSLTSPNANPNADPDHDGVPNWAEYLAGTNPVDAQSCLRLNLSSSGPLASSLALQWLSAPGKLYRLETTSSLAGNAWTVLAENLPGDGSVQKFVPTNLTSAARFYRIQLQQ